MTTNFIFTTADKVSKFNYPVLIEEQPQGNYQATVLGISDCQTTGKTREAALANLRQLLGVRLQKAEIISLEIDLSKLDHPWMKFAGKYQDDVQFDEMLDSIQAYRRELDAAMEEYYIKLDREEVVQ
ncbi:MAG TPA: HicB family protein [Cyanobacteria bacterium UBA11149]|nr:HicB family protein [Cyanobacteria bacterium UBA11366]HBK66310.1 HicB family protein [Cyanobacteria bacterium UBA11166]HBR77219.1 HicB family protein [Cyanobacteria bacterium UBA11159]HBS72263.1 HicB family protein [Cyanobacteria bacterium UBA11153]HBW87661.1 HicB family protein [Cyanobacteria bacterium UBA11149]HCA96655.1 HicB family protein [Cyanobacteria bacterium UBA9226]